MNDIAEITTGHGPLHLTRFWGGAANGVCIQLTMGGVYAGQNRWVTIPLVDVPELIRALKEAVGDVAPEERKTRFIIDHESYGVRAEFDTIGEAQAHMHACGADFAKTKFTIQNGMIIDELGQFVGHCQ